MPSTEQTTAEMPTHDCPRCGYDLSGETARWSEACPLDGVCPECGLAFAWRDVLSPAYRSDRLHVELRERPFLTGLLASVRIAFVPPVWMNRVPLPTPLEYARLWWFCLIAVLAPGACWYLLQLGAMFVRYFYYQRSVTTSFDWALLLTNQRVGWSLRSGAFWIVLCEMLWLVGVLLIARASHRSFRSARYRLGHLLRVVPYAIIPIQLAAFAIQASFTACDAFDWFPLGTPSYTIAAGVWDYALPVGSGIWCVLLLWGVFTRYFRFERPLALLCLSGALAASPGLILLGMVLLESPMTG